MARRPRLPGVRSSGAARDARNGRGPRRLQLRAQPRSWCRSAPHRVPSQPSRCARGNRLTVLWIKRAVETRWSGGLVRLPEFDGVAFRIMDARETPDARHVPFGFGDHLDACAAKLGADAVKVVDAKVQHPLLVRSEVIRIRREGC